MPAAREYSLAATDGTPLFARELMPDGAPRGGVLVLHGLGEHSGRYAHVLDFFARQGWAVCAFDHRGHGRSGGARGDTATDDAILQDIKTVLDDFAARTGGAPLLFGHSMGGLFAARFATAGWSPLRGLMLSSPALALPLSGVQKMLLAVLSRLAPGFGAPNGVDSSLLSHDPKVGAAYDADPLVHRKITARLLRSMLAAIEGAQLGAARLALPVLLQVAGDDRLVDASGSRRFHASLTQERATLHWYDGLYHEIFNELEQARVFADLQAWLAQR